MTTPVGSGRNACYGYEGEEEGAGGAQPALSNTQDASVGRAGSPADSATGGAGGATASDAAPSEEGDPGACDTRADYLTLAGTAGFILGATVSATLDRYGHVYTLGGGGLGTPGVGFSLMAGYLRDPDHPCEPPTEEQLSRFLTGSTVTDTGGAGAAVGVSRSSDLAAREIGIATPQIGRTWGMSARHW